MPFAGLFCKLSAIVEQKCQTCQNVDIILTVAELPTDIYCTVKFENMVYLLIVTIFEYLRKYYSPVNKA